MIKKLMMLCVTAMAAVCVYACGVYGPFVPGAEVEVGLVDYVGYSAKNLPPGLKFDKKTGFVKGKPKKPGEYQVTFTKRGIVDTCIYYFTVGPMPTISITMEGDTEKCKVTGASKPGKGYLVGKKVSLSAKGPKGTAFTGWFKDGAPWPDETDYLEPKLRHVMTKENLSLVARFEKEKISIWVPSCCFEFSVGKEVSYPFLIETQSGVKSVKGLKLPTGLNVKKDKATGSWSVTGKPQKEGTWNATITVTANSGAVERLPVTMTIEKEKMSVACDGLSPLTVGEEVSIPVTIETQSGVKSVKGSKLPSGLKIKKDKATGNWFVTGKPKKEGTWNATIKVTAKSGAVEELAIPFTIVEAYVSEGNLTAANSYFREPLKNGKDEKYMLSVGVTNVDDFLPILQLNKGKLAVSGLPAGLKYDAANGKITGVATKSGTYTVTLTVIDGKAKYVSTVTVEVEALPNWLVGTFRGKVITYGSGWSDACGFEVKITSKGSVSAELLEADPAWGSVKLKTSGLVREGWDYSFAIRDGDFEDGEEGSMGEVYIHSMDYDVGCLSAQEFGIDEDGDEFEAFWEGYQDIYSVTSSVIPKPVFKTDNKLYLNIDQEGGIELTFGAKGEVTVSEPGVIWSNARLLPWNYDFENNVVGASLWVMGYDYLEDCTFGAELYMYIPVAQDGTAKASEISIGSVNPGPNW